jgi:hypothetical protein
MSAHVSAASTACATNLGEPNSSDAFGVEHIEPRTVSPERAGDYVARAKGRVGAGEPGTPDERGVVRSAKMSLAEQHSNRKAWCCVSRWFEIATIWPIFGAWHRLTEVVGTIWPTFSPLGQMVSAPNGLRHQQLRGALDHLAKWPALLAKWYASAGLSGRVQG